jgi:hypothetical protein
MVYLQFPPNVAVGFRVMFVTEVCGDIPLVVMAAMQHLLGRIDVRCITLAVSQGPGGEVGLLIRFEGLRGSLEITTGYTHARLQSALFDPRGVLSSHPLRIENVRELHIVGCSFDDGQGLHHINTAMATVKVRRGPRSTAENSRNLT